MEQLKIQKVWVDDHAVYARTQNGLTASYEFSRWPSFQKATSQQKEDFYLSYTGIHWPQLDEDLSFEGMFNEAELCDRTIAEDSVAYSK